MSVAARSSSSGAAPAELTGQARVDFIAAREVFTKAVEDDKAGRFHVAIEGYKRGLELWIRVLKATPELAGSDLHVALTAKVEQYMKRAEDLKAAVQKRQQNKGGGFLSLFGFGSSSAPGGAAKPLTPKPVAAAPPPPVRTAAPRGRAGPGPAAASTRRAPQPQPRGRPAAARGTVAAPRGGRAVTGGAGGARAGVASGLRADGPHEELIKNEVLDSSPGVRWDDVAGLKFAKKTLQEAVVLPTTRPDIFHGLRSPPKGLLLFGPPGTGKTLLAKAVATESGATFFNISASALTSKWMGEGEKLVRAMFSLARKAQPSVIFIDEIDSMLSARASGEHEASRRLKTEFLVQLDGAATAQDDRVVVMGATNRPMELDDAVLRRLAKRIYIPLPEEPTREALLQHQLTSVPCELSRSDLRDIVRRTEGYSGSDLAALCREAAMEPVRELGDRLMTVGAADVRPVRKEDFIAALRVIRPSVATGTLREIEEWNRSYGSSG